MMRRADLHRIAALERWHAAQDCEERGGHTLPEGCTAPGRAQLHGVREVIDTTTFATTRHLHLPEGVVEVPCTHCGTDLLAAER